MRDVPEVIPGAAVFPAGPDDRRKKRQASLSFFIADR
jgi:hypothetical protein